MAHREDIAVKDLRQLHRLLNKISSPLSDVGLKPSNAFQTADSCLALLEDVVSESIEAAPPLQKWARYGPSYFKWKDDPEYTEKADKVFFHYLAFRFRRNRRSEWFGAGFCFEDGDDEPLWDVGGQTRKSDAWWTEPIAAVCDKHGVLDREKMLKSFLKVAKSHGVKS